MLKASINYGGGYVGIAEVLHSCPKARENFNEIEDSWSFFSFRFLSFFLNNIMTFFLYLIYQLTFLPTSFLPRYIPIAFTSLPSSSLSFLCQHISENI